MAIPTMTTVPNSSQIAAVGRDGDSLYVQFHGHGGKPGSTYRYWRKGTDGPHPIEHHDKIIAAPSAGKHWNAHKGAFSYEKL